MYAGFDKNVIFSKYYPTNIFYLFVNFIINALYTLTFHHDKQITLLQIVEVQPFIYLRFGFDVNEAKLHFTPCVSNKC